MNAEEEFQFREDLKAVLEWRSEVNARLDYLEEFLLPEHQARLRKERALRQIQDVRSKL